MRAGDGASVMGRRTAVRSDRDGDGDDQIRRLPAGHTQPHPCGAGADARTPARRQPRTGSLGLSIFKVEDRDGAPLLLASTHSAAPWLRHVSVVRIMMGRSCARHLPSWGNGPWTSSGHLILRQASNRSHGAGSSNTPSLGSIATGDWQRPLRQPSKARRGGLQLRPPFNGILAGRG
jgi:hypothetical protein